MNDGFAQSRAGGEKTAFSLRELSGKMPGRHRETARYRLEAQGAFALIRGPANAPEPLKRLLQLRSYFVNNSGALCKF
ncbi:TPA: hypothetical protein PPN70_002050 [Serratia rubidaea]|uniref:hypothetical protein n=1 Tax=Serratia rubidaea TaxID=61652 RepID=UPI0023AF9854|nr:hypothetical protein [Serratia rubidaea]MDK1702214.1 hypothetical protein [Serratia rubidaea]HDJ1439632.1 hypothetical protein [Serratia rubidaea]HDJ1448385.1 hypothetical protein [Serratia rubidaea]HDJ1462045.1 hypothetical protein [Serratia rubidaea]HDJ2770534.1 hypothetical protein [Serratia rubidaea]